MSKVNNSNEIKKQVTVNDFTFSKEGLWLNYNTGEVECDQIMNPEQTCELLYKHEEIEDYQGQGFRVVVTIENEKGKPEQITWSEFAEFYSDIFNKELAEKIAMTLERTKRFETVII